MLSASGGRERFSDLFFNNECPTNQEKSAALLLSVSRENSFTKVREIFELSIDAISCPLAGDVGEGSRLVVRGDEVFEEETCFLLFSFKNPQGGIRTVEVENEISVVFLGPVSAKQMFDQGAELRFAFHDTVGELTGIDVGWGVTLPV